MFSLGFRIESHSVLALVVYHFEIYLYVSMQLLNYIIYVSIDILFRNTFIIKDRRKCYRN